MADKRISQLIERTDIANNDVLPIVASGATTTNKVTISTIQEWMQDNLDVGVTSVGITVGTSGTDVNVSGSPVTTSGNITINIPNASATARGVVSTGTQTFAGAKTFNSDLIVNGVTIGKGLASNANNTAIGVSALSSNTTGTLNTATGVSALLSNTGGNGNTANGANSLLANTTGAYNVGSGSQSLYSNTTGSYNVASGADALYSNIGGNHNTGIGAGAGYYIADGSTPNTTSDFSIYLGSNSKASVDGAQNEVVIGYNAIGSGSNTVTIGNSSVTDNYFTGTIRSTAFRLAANGTADAVVLRNVSGTTGSDSGATTIGFNGSDNIFVNTQSRGGFILGFNNSVSNREYTLQDASGTLAFTSDIPSLTGYVTLDTAQTITATKTFTTSGSGNTININHTSGSGHGVEITKAGNGEGLRVIKTSGSGNAVTISGGLLSAEAATLTGALNGTSASFTGNITSTGGFLQFANNYGIEGRNAANSAYRSVLKLNTSNQIEIGRDTDISAIILGTASANNALTLASTGAATFSSSVTATSETTNSSLIQQWSYNSGPIAYRLRLNTIVSSGLVKYSFDTTNNSTEYSNNLVLDRGNVGIGTSSPSTKFVVSNAGAGGIEMQGNSSVSGGAFLQTYNRSTNAFIDLDIVANNTIFRTGQSYAEAMRITSSGSVGIGTASPSTILNVSSTTPIIRINPGTNNPSAVEFGILNGGTNSYAKIDAINDVSIDTNLRFFTNTSSSSTQVERMRITSTGNVGIGTASPLTKLNVDSTSNDGLYLSSFQTTTGAIDTGAGLFFGFSDGANPRDAASIKGLKENGTSGNSSSYLSFSTRVSGAAVTERMRITSGGAVLIGHTAATYSEKALIQYAGTGNQGFHINQTGSSAANDKILFSNSNGIVGYIRTDGSATSYVTASDYRLKENVKPVEGALSKLTELKPCTFNFKSNPDEDVIGFLAHEVQEVMPQAVSGDKDAVQIRQVEVSTAELDEEGNVIKEAVIEEKEVPVYQGIDHSKLVPLLVASIQELKAEIEALKSQING